MMHRFRRLLANDVSLLVVGGFVAQAVNVLAYPIMSHFYSPTDFGLFSAMTAISGFAGAVLLLRIELLYQIAPQEEEEGLLTSAVVVAMVMTALVFVLALLFGQVLIQKVQIGLDGSDWHWGYAGVLAMLVLVQGVFSLAWEYWAKSGRYGRLALAQTARTVLTVGLQLGLVMLLKDVGSTGLIAGFALGLTGATLLIWPIRASLVRTLLANLKRAFAITASVLNQYRAYIRVDVVNVLIRMSTIVAYPVFVLMAYGVFETGLYAVASRIAFIPIDVLGAAISTVFFQRFALAVREGTGTTRLYLTTLLGSLAIALAIAGLLALVAGPLVDLVFGGEWARTSIIILYLLPTFLARFVTTCIGSTPLALRRPELLFHWNIVQLVIIGGTLAFSRGHSLEVFLLSSGLGLIAVSVLYSIVLYMVVSRRPTNGSPECQA